MIIGTTINSRYDIKMLIGDGGMANVYLAYDQTQKCHVAIKSLRYELSKDERFIKRFKRESAQVINLSHPNIVHVYTVGDYKEQPFIVMEYVKGKTLKDFLREKGALEVQDAVHIMKQLAQGVLYAHQNKIIHRDLKTQNIMITDELEVKITDFGIALSSNEADVTQTNTIMGSVHYLAPELARGNLATERSDIYALGIIFYELLTGTVPFKGEGAVNIALQHLESQMPSIKWVNDQLPTHLDNIIQRATNKLPIERYASVEELLLELSESLDEVASDLSPQEEEDELDKTMIMPNLKKEVSEKMETLQQPKRIGLLNRSVAAVYTIFLIMAMALYYFIVFAPTHYRVEEVRLPNVLELTVDEAMDKLEGLGLKQDPVISYLDDNTVPEGSIVRISPSVGTRIKINSNVTIYVAR